MATEQEFITTFIINADQALQNAQKVRQEVELMKTRIQQLAEQTGESYANIGKSIKAATDPGVNNMQELSRVITQSIKELNEADKSRAKEAQEAAQKVIEAKRNETREILANNQQQANVTRYLQRTQQSASGLSQVLNGLGGVAKYVFATIFGITVIGILRQVVQWFGNATQAGLEFAKSMFQLEVGVRVLQRSGVDITIRETYQNIALLRRQFQQFTTKDLVAGTAQLYNLIRDLGLTKEQIVGLQNAIANLAVVNGRSMEEVQRTVALALSSGYTEGLQRLGVSINRVTIAEEAARLGWEGGYTALTEQQRALATYNLILEKTAKFEEDLQAYRESLPGQIDVANASIEEQSNILGTKLLPAKAAWATLSAKLMDTIFPGVSVAVSIFSTGVYNLGEIIKGVLTIFSLMLDRIEEGAGILTDFVKTIPGLENVGKTIEDILNRIWKIRKGGENTLGNILGDTDVVKQDGEEIKEITEETKKDVLDVIEWYADERRKIELNLQRDLEKIERQGADRRLEIGINYLQRITKLWNKYQQDLQDLLLRYEFDRQQIDDETNDEISDATQKYRERELERENDYQEKLKRLREEFLFDLEDALRERDARQVLRLIRRYNLEKERLGRENTEEKENNQRKYEDELREINERREEKLRKLQEELEFRQMMLRIQRDREIEEERVKFQQEIEELARNLAVQRRERQISYEQQMMDLEYTLQQKLKKLAEGFVAEYGITQQGVRRIYDFLKQYYGQGGAIEQLVQYYAQMLAQLQSLGQRFLDFSGSLSGVDPSKFGNSGSSFGGSLSGVDPSKFGNSGNSITPNVSRMMSKTLTSNVLDANGQKIVLEIFLSPGLEAEIIDKSVGSVAATINDSLGMMRSGAGGS